jgi:capsule polysaccharide export protein KpsE/RkpR
MTQKQPSKFSYWTLLSIAISVIALIFSYFGFLSSPDIKVFVSAPSWVIRSTKSENSTTDNQLWITLTSAFSNHGARNGIVGDILLRLESQDDATKRGTILAQRLMTKSFRRRSADSTESSQGHGGDFCAYFRHGKQSLTGTYIFLPMTLT